MKWQLSKRSAGAYHRPLVIPRGSSEFARAIRPSSARAAGIDRLVSSASMAVRNWPTRAASSVEPQSNGSPASARAETRIPMSVGRASRIRFRACNRSREIRRVDLKPFRSGVVIGVVARAQRRPERIDVGPTAHDLPDPRSAPGALWRACTGREPTTPGGNAAASRSRDSPIKGHAPTSSGSPPARPHLPRPGDPSPGGHRGLPCRAGTPRATRARRCLAARR